MSWENARDFLTNEFSDGADLPIAYNIYYKDGPHQGTYRVVVLPPAEVVKLSTIRKRAGIHEGNVGGVDTVNFAPTGGCHCCGR